MIYEGTDEFGNPILIDSETGQPATSGYDVVDEPPIPAPPPAPVQSAPTPQPSATSEEVRERQLRDAASNPIGTDRLLELGVDPTEYANSLRDIQAKVALLDQARAVEQSYKDADTSIPTEVKQSLERTKAVTISKAAPFIELSPEGTMKIVNVDSALKTGVTLAELENIGFPKAGLERQLATERVTKFGDISSAISGGQIEEVRKLQGYGLLSAEDVLVAQTDIADRSFRESSTNQLTAYINPDTKELNLTEAIKAGVDPSTIRLGGYGVSQEKYSDVKRVILAERIVDTAEAEPDITNRNLSSEFQGLPNDIQKDLIQEAFYDQKQLGKLEFAELTPDQQEKAVRYYVGSLVTREDIAKYENKNLKNAEMVIVAVGTKAPNPIGFLAIFTILTALGVYTYANKDSINRAINNYLEKNETLPDKSEVYIVTDEETIPLQTIGIPVDTKIPPMIAPRMDTRLPPQVKRDTSIPIPPLVPVPISGKLPLTVPPRFDTTLPGITAPVIDTGKLITAGGELINTPPVRRVVTQERWKTWITNYPVAGSGAPSGSYIKGKDIMELDQKIYSAFTNGAIGREDYQDYLGARDNYLRAKTGVDNSVQSVISQNPNINTENITQEAIATGVLAGIYVLTQNKNATADEVRTAIEDAIREHTKVDMGLVTDDLLQQLTEVSTRLATQTQTQTATKIATQTQTQTATQTATQVATQVATQTATTVPATAVPVPTTATMELAATTTATQRVAPLPLPVLFEDDPEKVDKLKHGFITWRQGKTYWAIPQSEDGKFDTEDKVASGKPFQGTTKFPVGKGSVYKSMEYVGSNPPAKAFIDVGWAQFNVVKDGKDVKITKITPDDTANWEGVNKYTTPEAIAQKRIADIERYRKQYSKPRRPRNRVPAMVKEPTMNESPPQIISSGKRTYLGYEILPSQLGGEL